ncbi:DUF3152 domain-containing protein [Bifidobacterium sp. CP2]|uniref:DUF3152 domain-containing protein n=1 Tax=Bifidobacterium sp. CP2 TaxID=2809025 RepID=UPI001BDC8B63|nr:DUF3152 domain-containing protein [Bifidobacterium sp. CP2]MBT1181758.1 DUF3152 domain-containing protein [Bifidobacterium sp. CP2]
MSGVVATVRRAMSPQTSPSKRDYAIRRVVVIATAAVIAIAVTLAACAAFGVFGRGSGSGDAGDGRSTTTQTAGVSDGKGAKNAGGKGTSSKNGKTDSEGDGKDAKSEKDAADADNDAVALDKQALAVTDAQRAALLDKARQVAAASGKTRREVTYCVASKGNVGDVTAFATQAFEALNSEHGWARAGVTFVQAGEGQAGSCSFTLILSEAQYLPSYSSGCSTEYSCRVGDDVIINWDRWRGATPSWTGAGGTLRRYRAMAVNHEVGHRLGHFDNETPCGGSGQPAPLMQQQSKGMNGCTPNEWPLDSELWTR